MYVRLTAFIYIHTYVYGVHLYISIFIMFMKVLQHLTSSLQIVVMQLCGLFQISPSIQSLKPHKQKNPSTILVASLIYAIKIKDRIKKFLYLSSSLCLPVVFQFCQQISNNFLEQFQSCYLAFKFYGWSNTNSFSVVQWHNVNLNSCFFCVIFIHMYVCVSKGWHNWQLSDLALFPFAANTF